MKKIILLLAVMGIVVSSLTCSSRKYPDLEDDGLPKVSPATLNKSGRNRADLHDDSHYKMLLETNISILTALELLEPNVDKKDAITAVLNSAKVDLQSRGFNSERLEVLAQQVLEVVASTDSSIVKNATKKAFDLDGNHIEPSSGGEEQQLIGMRRQFAALLTQITPLEEHLRYFENEKLPRFLVVIIKTIGDTAMELVDNIISLDANLTSNNKSQLMKLAEQINDRLNLIAQQRGGRAFNPQAAAKVTVFVIQGLVEISAILGIQVQKLSLADKPELVQRRGNYACCGIAALSIAALLTAIIVGTNAAGYTDIQVLPSMFDLIKPAAGLL